MKRAQRLPFFDSARGFAMILMAIYHFSFDLDHFGVIHQDLNRSVFWVLFRGIIMTLFMGLIGVSLYLGKADLSRPRYRKRIIQVAACAMAITVATYFLFPKSWVFFGVLHLAVIASLIGPLLIRKPLLCLPVGIAFVILPRVYHAPLFQEPGWNILGLAYWLPITEDYAPIFPWLGVVMLGVVVGWSVSQWPTKWPSRVTNPSSGRFAFLEKLGLYSLPFYMTHQVVLFPIAWAISRLVA